MADSQPGRFGTGSFVTSMPLFPPPQYSQGTSAPPAYPPFSHNPSAPQNFSVPGQIHQSQPHPSSFGPRFPGTPPVWSGYGFQGPPPSYGCQATHPIGIPGPPTKFRPGMIGVAEDSAGPPGVGFGQQRSSFVVPSSQNVSVVTSLGQNTVRPPGTGSGNFKASSGLQVSQETHRVTSSGHSANDSGRCVEVLKTDPGAAPSAIAHGRRFTSGTQSSAADGGSIDSRSSCENPQLLNVVEQAMLHSGKDKIADLKEVISQIRTLTSQVERAAQQVRTLVNIDLNPGKSSIVACPFDSAHKIISEGLFQHYLRCPLNPKPQLHGQGLMDSLYHRRVTAGSVSSTCCTSLDSSRMLESGVTGGAVSSSSRPEFDIWGGKFLYGEAPAVVQVPMCTIHPPSLGFPPSPVIQVPGRRATKSESVDAAESSATGDASTSGDTFLLLPSRYFFLAKEIEAWESLPSRTSSLVIEAAAGLGRVRKREVLDWLLVNSPAHGVVIDFTLACHILTLTRACFHEVQNEAFALLDRADCKPVAVTTATGLSNNQPMRTGEVVSPSKVSESEMRADVQAGPSDAGNMIAHGCLLPRVEFMDCSRVFRCIPWLSAQLCPLYGSSQSKSFTLNVLKHSMIWSGNLRSSPFVDTFGSGNLGSRSKVEGETDDGEKVIQSIENHGTDTLSFRSLVVPDDVPRTELMAVGSSSPLVKELDAAISAVYERAVLERYLRSPFPANWLPKFQLIQEYEAAVRLAAEERMKRPNYRPVLEFDGLIWHRSQLEGKNKNKTREEILAEERDYKRRRMSYRGKKLKRTPTQVVRDIIEGHMEEIVAAGGIGCSVKQSMQAPLAARQFPKGEVSVASNESSFVDAEQLRMPASNSSVVGRAQSDFEIHEKARGSREHSRRHSEVQKSDKGFRLSSKDMNISRVENYGGGEAAKEQCHLKVNNSISRQSQLSARAEDSEYFDNGGKSTDMNGRSTPDDHWESSRIGNESRNVRPSSHDHRQTERYSMSKSDIPVHESHAYSDARDYKPRRGYGHDSREDQDKNSSSYRRYGDDKDREDHRGRIHNDKLEGRKKRSTWDNRES